jgi:acetyl esterase/lipase
LFLQGRLEEMRIARCAAAVFFFCLASQAWAATPGKSALLWPDGAPGAVGTTDDDKPSLDVYVPASVPTKSAVVVLPGGGYQGLALSYEGTEEAHWLNDRGVAAFVLHYRLAPRYHYPAPIQDGERAIRYVRAHAAEFGIKPDQIGIWGFSAGGHLASSVATHFDIGQPDASDPIERVSDRPDFAILAYGVTSMETDITHGGSRRSLLGPNPDPALVEQFTNAKQVTQDTPPCFLFHTSADKVVPVQNSINFYVALQRMGVPAELHVFEQGAHGAGMGGHSPQLSKWPELLEGWMKLHGWM